jgi:hypothetical protein
MTYSDSSDVNVLVNHIWLLFNKHSVLELPEHIDSFTELKLLFLASFLQTLNTTVVGMRQGCKPPIQLILKHKISFAVSNAFHDDRLQCGKDLLAVGEVVMQGITNFESRDLGPKLLRNK